MKVAFYGVLRPGGDNHHEVRSIPGTWRSATVRGWRYDITWGPADGYPGVSLDNDGPTVDVDVLDSDELDRHIDRLDRFEGPGYRRVETEATFEDGTTSAVWIYETEPEA